MGWADTPPHDVKHNLQPLLNIYLKYRRKFHGEVYEAAPSLAHF